LSPRRARHRVDHPRAEALAALKHHEVDLALVDRCLRGLDGAEFLRELQSSARSAMLALLSDRLVPQWARVARAIGAYDVLLKPMHSRQIGNLMAAYSRTCLPTNVLVVEPPWSSWPGCCERARLGSISISATQRKTP